tara:strand:- start:619 stop:777 length:159 start_codon:yes stop_codon:yes gene_type:complete
LTFPLLGSKRFLCRSKTNNFDFTAFFGKVKGNLEKKQKKGKKIFSEIIKVNS